MSNVDKNDVASLKIICISVVILFAIFAILVEVFLNASVKSEELKLKYKTSELENEIKELKLKLNDIETEQTEQTKQ